MTRLISDYHHTVLCLAVMPTSQADRDTIPDKSVRCATDDLLRSSPNGLSLLLNRRYNAMTHIHLKALLTVIRFRLSDGAAGLDVLEEIETTLSQWLSETEVNP